jgi:hypothetical protein
LMELADAIVCSPSCRLGRGSGDRCAKEELMRESFSREVYALVLGGSEFRVVVSSPIVDSPWALDDVTYLLMRALQSGVNGY